MHFVIRIVSTNMRLRSIWYYQTSVQQTVETEGGISHNERHSYYCCIEQFEEINSLSFKAEKCFQTRFLSFPLHNSDKYIEIPWFLYLGIRYKSSVRDTMEDCTCSSSVGFWKIYNADKIQIVSRIVFALCLYSWYFWSICHL